MATCATKDHVANAAELEARLEAAQKRLIFAQKEVSHLQMQLNKMPSKGTSSKNTRQIRIFMEGAFDITHYGHMNAFRQGAALGNYLIVGVNSSESIAECKGSRPVMTDDERCAAVAACRFVDEVIPKTPYVMTPEYLAKIMKEFAIDFVVHGDEPCLVNGQDVYGHVKKIGKFKSIPRTEGVSTTDVVGRILLMNTRHHLAGSTDLKHKKGDLKSARLFLTGQQDNISTFLTTTSLLRIFAKAMPTHLAKGKTIVYMDGSFDMFHPGHSAALREAKKLGDYLIVGVHNDQVVNRIRGMNYPILNMQERVLSVLACRYVDDVVIDAPYVITREMISSLNISLVCVGSNAYRSPLVTPIAEEKKRMEIAGKMGILREINSTSTYTINVTVKRIINESERFISKVQKKSAAEAEYYKQRYSAVKASTTTE